MKRFIIHGIAFLTLALLAGVMVANAQSNSTVYQYDDLNRLTQVTYSNGITISYTYDALGNRLSKTISAAVVIQPPTVTTSNASQINSTTAICGGNVTSDGGANVTARGVCWSTSHNPTTSSSHTADGTGTSSFTSSITGLTPGTTYFVRAYATNAEGTAYGNEVSFTTSCGDVNVAISGSSTVNYGQSVTLTALGASTYIWSTGQTGSSITVTPSATTTYSVTGTDANGCTGIATKTVTVIPQLAVVTTANATQVSSTSAISGGNIASDGGANVTARGVCWSTSHNPTTSSSHTSDGTGTGSFTSSITGLTPGTTYFVRAYATNAEGTAYGNEVSFTTSCGDVNVAISGSSTVNYGQSVTLTAFGASTYIWSTGQTGSSITVTPSATTTYSVTGTDANGCTGIATKTVTVIPQLAVVTTANATQVSSTSAISGGNITSDGGANVTARGVCWSTSHNPTTSSSHTADGTGTGGFTSSITGLTPGTTYFVRAYATNAEGTTYGNEVSFTTSCGDVNVAISGSSTVNYGQSVTLTASGASTYIWSTGQTGSSITVTPSATTTYSVTGTDVNGCTGIATKTVTVIPQLAVVTTANTTHVSNSSATCGGNVISDGGTPVTAKGVCWSVYPNPTLSDNYTSDGTGTGSFTSNITELSDTTTYYVRAYAVNNVGVAYGDQVSFTTTPFICGASTVKDHEGNTYNTIQLGYLCWTKENMRCVTSPSTGTMILETDPENTSSYTGKKVYYVFNNEDSTNLYGLLYNWNAALDTFNTQYGETSTDVDTHHAVYINQTYRRGICPPHWHIPCDAEWLYMIDYVNNQSDYRCNGGNMRIAKALAYNSRWALSANECSIGNNQASNNATGFSAIPTFASQQATYFCSSTELANYYAIELTKRWGFYSFCDTMYYNAALKNELFSVRCIYDEIDGELIEITPTVSTNYVTNISSNSALVTGSVYFEGSSSVTSRGICWSNSPTPTILDNFSTEGIGMGGFFSQITGLSPNTTYYVRAYATNNAGTGYGNELSFTTNDVSVDEFTPAYKLSAYPNPTHGKSLISADNPNVLITNIVIYDVNGKKVKEFVWEGDNQSQIIDLSEMNPGTYSITLINDRKHIGTIKVIKL